MEETIELRSPLGGLRARVSSQSGALTGLYSEPLGWGALDEARGSRPFEMLLPLEHTRRNRTRGARQPQPDVEQPDDGTVQLRFGHVVSEAGGEHDIVVIVEFRIADDGLVGTMSIENNSPLVVENVVFPCLTDLQSGPAGDRVDFFTYDYAGARRLKVRPHFTNTPGYFGVDRPTIVHEPTGGLVPVSPFLLLDGNGGGLYLGIDVPEPELLGWVAELEPGYSESIESLVPSGPTIGNKDVRVEVSPAHLPYIMPGERRRLPAVRLQFYEGDWHNGAAIYRARRRTWMGSSTPPSWASEPHSWQQVQFNSPEGERRYHFSELPEIARECARSGVRAIQLVGWNDGGQDQNNPCHDPDPLLGGAAGLHRAIAECQQLGVKIILFTKFVWSDRATERFRNELTRLAVHDPYGDYYVHPGYRYQTLTQLFDVNTKRLVPMCFAAREWIEICRQEFQKVLDSGADGILYDECFHHGPALACFDIDHGHRYGQPVYAHDVDFVRWLREQTDSVREDFLFAGEACTDWQLSEYHLSYHRSESIEHVPVMRYLRPDAQLMTAVTGFDDRGMVNQCLLYRYIISYEPYNFKGRLFDMPLTVAYGSQMDALRTELRDWLWDGEFQDTIGARVTERVSSAEHAPYSVFRGAADGSLAVVVANYSDDGVLLDVSTDSWAHGSFRLVGESSWKDGASGVHVPARSAAVVLEQQPPGGK